MNLSGPVSSCLVALGLILSVNLLQSRAVASTAAAPSTNAVVAQQMPNVRTNWSAATAAQLREAAESGKMEAQFELGYRHEHGEGVPQDYSLAFKYYRLAAEQGHAMAQNNLGYFYFSGLGVERDYEKAVSWYRKSAEQGEPYGQTNLGWMYARGVGVPEDAVQARLWLKKAADQNFARAQFILGSLAEMDGVQGTTVIGNYVVAAEWFERAATNGHVQAMVSLGDLYHHGKLERDEKEAVRWYRQAAERGSDEAVMRLADLHLHNRPNLPLDHPESLKWFLVAAQKGNALAQFHAACLLLEGERVQHDPAQAEQWLRKSVAGGYVEAWIKLSELRPGAADLPELVIDRDQFESQWYSNGKRARLLFATCCEEGRSGPVDYPRAARAYWRLLHESDSGLYAECWKRLIRLYHQGKIGFGIRALGPVNAHALAPRIEQAARWITEPETLFQIGELFLRGEILPPDTAQAFKYLSQAAQKGWPDAFNQLGELWASGTNGVPDHVEAVRWFRSAANKGSSRGMWNLARALQQGQGTEQDLVEAGAWLQLAARSGFTPAIQELPSHLRQLSESQRGQATNRLHQLQQTLPASRGSSP